jgi:hypothetical protein
MQSSVVSSSMPRVSLPSVIALPDEGRDRDDDRGTSKFATRKGLKLAERSEINVTQARPCGY